MQSARVQKPLALPCKGMQRLADRDHLCAISLPRRTHAPSHVAPIVRANDLKAWARKNRDRWATGGRGRCAAHRRAPEHLDLGSPSLRRAFLFPICFLLFVFKLGFARINVPPGLALPLEGDPLARILHKSNKVFLGCGVKEGIVSNGHAARWDKAPMPAS